jgi:hypothetical protein
MTESAVAHYKKLHGMWKTAACQLSLQHFFKRDEIVNPVAL